MSVRLRRLQADYERLAFVLDGHPQIRIDEATGNPPERYTIEYRLKGLVEEGAAIVERNVHRAQIILGPDYPRSMPRCVMLTPVFHPNIDHLAICTADIGSVGQRLEDTVIFIGKMIAFQDFNLQSPRNGDAARWTREHLDRLPIDPVDLFTERLMDTSVAQRIASKAAAEADRLERVVSPRCVNCGEPSGAGGPVRCRSCSGWFCEDCVMACERCGSWACVAHAGQACDACSQSLELR